MGCCDQQGEESAGNCPPPTLGAGYRRLVPAPRFGSSSGGSLVRGWLRRHLPPDVGGCGPPVRTVRKLQNCLQAGGGKRRTCRRRQKPTHTKLLWSSTTVSLIRFGKIWLAVYLSKNFAFSGSGWGLTSAGLCTPWLPSCAACSWDVSPSVANTGEYFVCIREPIYCRVRPFRRVASGASGICPLPYRRPGTMSREGTKRPLASPCNAFSAMQRGGEARLLHRVTLFHPPRATCSFRWGGAAI